jgi:hypothetical protein
MTEKIIKKADLKDIECVLCDVVSPDWESYNQHLRTRHEMGKHKR